MAQITIQQVRQQYPDYADLSDRELADALHKKFYADMPVQDFYGKVGLQTQGPDGVGPDGKPFVTTASEDVDAAEADRLVASGEYQRDPATGGIFRMLSTPDGQPRTTGERFRDNAVDGFQHSGAGAVLRAADPGADGLLKLNDALAVDEGSPIDWLLDRTAGDERGFLPSSGREYENPISAAWRALTGGNMRGSPQAVQERQRRADFQTVSEADPWTNAEGGAIGKAVAGLATLGGQIGGAAASPESWVGGGATKGAPLVARAGEEIAERVATRAVARPLTARMAENAAVNVGVDATLQTGDMAAGVQDNYNPVQTGFAGALGAGFPAATDAAVATVRAIRTKFPGWSPRPAPEGVDPTMHAEAEAAEMVASDPDLTAMLEANGALDANPAFREKVAERLAARRQREAAARDVGSVVQDAVRQGLTPEVTARMEAAQTGPNVAPGVRSQIESALLGDVNPGFIPAPERPAVPEVVPVGARGADVGNTDVAEGMRANTPRLPYREGPAPRPMEEGEVARAQAAMQGGNANRAAPVGEQFAPEGRAPRDRDALQQDREAASAFDLAERQRQRVPEAPRDTQTGGQPDGPVAQEVIINDGFPVRVVGLGQNGALRVERYDPRTGTADAGAVPYEVLPSELRQTNYTPEPRRAQDFATRDGLEGASPEQPRMATDPVTREPTRTYQATEADADPNGTGRAPMPEQPEGPGPFRDQPRGETRQRAANEEELRQRYERAREEQAYRSAYERQRETGQTGQKSTNTAEAVDGGGRYTTTEAGFVKSNKGGPIIFDNQKMAAAWIIKTGHVTSKDQIFELANHPNAPGKFTVLERGRSGNDAGASARESGPVKGEAPTSPGGDVRTAEAPTNTAKGPVEQPSRPAEATTQSEVEAPRVSRETSNEDVQRSTDEELAATRAEDGRTSASVAQRRATARMYESVLEAGQNPNGKKLTPAERADMEAALEDYTPEMRAADEALDARQTVRGERFRAERDAKAKGERQQNGGDRPSEADPTPSLTEPTVRAKAPEVKPDKDGVIDADQIVTRPGYKADSAGDAKKLANEQLDELILHAKAEQQARDARFESEVKPKGQGGGWYTERQRPEWDKANPWPSYRWRMPNKGGAKSTFNLIGRPEVLEAFKKRINGRFSDTKQSSDLSGRGFTKADNKDIGRNADLAELETEVSALKDGPDVKPSAPISSKNSRVGRFYSGLDPEAVFEDLIKPAARHLSKRAERELRQWNKDMARFRRDASAVKGGMTPKMMAKGMRIIARGAFIANADVLHNMARKYASIPEAQQVADMIGTDPGSGRAITAVFQAAAQQRSVSMVNQLANVLDVLPDDLHRAMVDDLTGVRRAAPNSRVAVVARRVRNLLDNQHDYLKGAGIDLGYVRGGYFPRMLDEDKVLRDAAGYQQAMAKVYRSMGDGAADARAKALAAYEGVAGIGHGAVIRGLPGQAATKGRTLPKSADAILDAYYVRDPREALSNYFLQTSRAAEYTRRFGRNGEKLQEAYDAMRRGGVSRDDMEQIEASVGSSLGEGWAQRPNSIARLGGYVQLWGLITTLPRTMLSSLGEAASLGVTTHNPWNGVVGLADSLREFTGFGREDDARDFGEAVGILGDAMTDMVISSSFTGEIGDKLSQKIAAGFFRTNMLHQITESQRVATVRIGRGFIDMNLRRAVEKGGKLAKRELAELGIPEEDIAAVAKWREKTGKTLPVEEASSPEIGALRYREALAAFTNKSIQNALASDRALPANTRAGAMVYGLTSFLYAYTRNILVATARNTKEAVKGTGYTAAERLELGLAPVAGLALLAAVQATVGDVRDRIFSKERWETQTDMERFIKGVSRAGLTGIADPLVNAITSAKYERDLSSIMSGPFLANIAKGGGAMTVGLLPGVNSDKTNNAEWNAAKAAYQTILAPAGSAALSLLPGGNMTRAAYGVGMIEGTSPDRANEFADAVVGERTIKPKKGRTVQRQEADAAADAAAGWDDKSWEDDTE